MRTATGLTYQRNGSFSRNADGHLVTASGGVLQLQGGGDLVIDSASFDILPDGMVMSKGEPLGRIAIVDFAHPASLQQISNGSFVATGDVAKPVDKPSLRSGTLEASNVANGTDMVSMMEAIRRAESGQKLVHAYDDMLGRTITTLGQG